MHYQCNRALIALFTCWKSFSIHFPFENLNLESSQTIAVCQLSRKIFLANCWKAHNLLYGICKTTAKQSLKKYISNEFYIRRLSWRRKAILNSNKRLPFSWAPWNCWIHLRFFLPTQNTRSRVNGHLREEKLKLWDGE